MASGRRLHRISPTVWHFALCLTVLAFVARAFIPLGFMPDAAKLKHGSLALTFCSASGEIKTVSVDVFAPPSEGFVFDDGAQALAGELGEHPTHDVSGATDCPYSVSTPLAVFTTGAMPSFSDLSYTDAVVLTPASTAPPLFALGSPLGSRAPPLHTS